jgi:hypothetical protein
VGFLRRNTGVANNMQAFPTSAEKYWLDGGVSDSTCRAARPTRLTAVHSYTEHTTGEFLNLTFLLLSLVID